MAHERMAQNLGIFDFRLSDTDMQAIKTLNQQDTGFVNFNDPQFVKYLIDLSVTFVRPDRDVAIIPRSMGTSSGIEQGQRKLLLDSFFRHKLYKSL